MPLFMKNLQSRDTPYQVSIFGKHIQVYKCAYLIIVSLLLDMKCYNNTFAELLKSDIAKVVFVDITLLKIVEYK
jgi:hypothetical protein